MAAGEVNMTVLKKDDMVQYIVKYITSFHFYSLCLFFFLPFHFLSPSFPLPFPPLPSPSAILLLADSVVIVLKMSVSSTGNLPEQRGD